MSLQLGLFWNSFFDLAQIGVTGLRFRGGAAAVGQGYNPHHAHGLALREGQNIPRADGSCGFGNPRAVHPHRPLLNNTGGKAAGFEEPRVPQPFINPQGRAGLGQPFSFRPIKACANGLSGSMRSFFSGLALKLRAASGLPP